MPTGFFQSACKNMAQPIRILGIRWDHYKTKDGGDRPQPTVTINGFANEQNPYALEGATNFKRVEAVLEHIVTVGASEATEDTDDARERAIGRKAAGIFNAMANVIARCGASGPDRVDRGIAYESSAASYVSKSTAAVAAAAMGQLEALGLDDDALAAIREAVDSAVSNAR